MNNRSYMVSMEIKIPYLALWHICIS